MAGNDDTARGGAFGGNTPGRNVQPNTDTPEGTTVNEARGGAFGELTNVAIEDLQGRTGPRGIQGEEGPPGPQGNQGPEGPAGDQGFQGVGILSVVPTTTTPSAGAITTATVNFTNPTGGAVPAPVTIYLPPGLQGETGGDGGIGNTGSQGIGIASIVPTTTTPTAGQPTTATITFSNPSGGAVPAPVTIFLPAGTMGADGGDGPTGPQGLYQVYIYNNETSAPTTPDPSAGITTPPTGWSFTPTAVSTGESVYISAGVYDPANTSANITWSVPYEATGEAGPEGPAGPQGDMGIQGATGNQGIQGLQGVQGATGLAGPQGNQGVAGPQGGRGIQGLIGPTGPEGPDGPQGPQGIDGEAGPQGNYLVQVYRRFATAPTLSDRPIYVQGTTTFDTTNLIGSVPPAGWFYVIPSGSNPLYGSQAYYDPADTTFTTFSTPYEFNSATQGPAGPPGHQGEPGLRGPQGEAGPVGPTGAQGSQGPQGDPGPQGQQGIRGLQGFEGTDGATGPQGSQGAQGQRGEMGLQGNVGPRGISIIDTMISAPTRISTGNEYTLTVDYSSGSDDTLMFVAPQGPAGTGGTTPVHADIQIGVARTTGVAEIETGQNVANTYTVTIGPSGTYSFVALQDATTSQGAATINNNTVSVAATNVVAGTITIRFTIVYMEVSTGVEHSVLRTETIRVGNGWFTALATSVPANNAAMTDRGIYRSGVTNRFNGAGDMYIALPTNTYIFRTGLSFISATAVTSGYTQTGYTLYDLGTLVSGEDLTVEVQNG